MFRLTQRVHGRSWWRKHDQPAHGEYDAECTYKITGHVLIGMGQQAVIIVLRGTGCHVSNTGVVGVAHRTSAIDACYIEGSKSARLQRPWGYTALMAYHG